MKLNFYSWQQTFQSIWFTSSALQALLNLRLVIEHVGHILKRETTADVYFSHSNKKHVFNGDFFPVQALVRFHYSAKSVSCFDLIWLLALIFKIGCHYAWSYLASLSCRCIRPEINSQSFKLKVRSGRRIYFLAFMPGCIHFLIFMPLIGRKCRFQVVTIVAK